MLSIVFTLMIVNSTVTEAQQVQLVRTIKAVAIVESHGDPNAIGDQGLAVGILQIQPVLVADCNRIVGHSHYTLGDRATVAKSVEMFVVYSLHYAPDGPISTWARNWVGGPNGHRKKCTLPYLRRVESVLKRF